jgi:hypothetical protein
MNSARAGVLPVKVSCNEEIAHLKRLIQQVEQATP